MKKNRLKRSKHGFLPKATNKLMVLVAILVLAVTGSQTIQAATGNLSKKDYKELTDKLVKQGLYRNKDGSIGGVFNLSDGQTFRVFKLDDDGNLWGVVKFGENEYKIAVFDYESVSTFIERKESVSVN